MLAADGIIFATPNYTLQVSAQMKALIDRCNLLLHCQRCAANMVRSWLPPAALTRKSLSIISIP